MFSVAAKRVSVLVWGVITDFSWQVLEFCEVLGPSWKHCFFEGYPKIFRRFWETSSYQLKVCSYKWWFNFARICWKLLNPLFPLSVKGSSVQVNRNSAQNQNSCMLLLVEDSKGYWKIHILVWKCCSEMPAIQEEWSTVLPKCRNMLDFFV